MTEFSTTATASLYQSIRDTTSLTVTFAVVSHRFQGSLRFDGTAQRKINVEDTLVWPTNPAVWRIGTRGTKIGIAAPPLDAQNMPSLILTH
jgi:hypothetical protein